MRYLKYITLLVAFIMATSCTESDIIEKRPANSKNKIQVVARVMPFADHDVSSRAIKEGEETNIASIWLAIFNGQKCENLLDDSDTVFEIDATNLREGYDLYIFANVDLSGFKTRLNDDDTENDPKLDDFLTYPIPVEGIVIPEFEEENCFPMMGVLESENINLENNIIEIPLYALYSKIVMNIEVRPDQAIPGELPARFRLDGYKVCNVPESVDFVGGTIGDTNDETGVSSNEYEVNIEGNQWAQGANSVEFSFYLPERFLVPETRSELYEYPFTKENGKYRAQDSIYMQRFKPELVKDNNPPATYVKFYGEFIDHQGHNYDVSYNIYVGNDNFRNFDIERNTQYNNYITIKGISNSVNQTNNVNAISIDYRVNVKRTQPAVINLRRETLLDSHFEVRPLRIQKNEINNIGNINAVKIEVLDKAKTNWMRIERSFAEGEDSGLYIKEGVSAGKRKFFTYNLITGAEMTNGDIAPLNESTEVVVPISTTGECVWIYVDECLDTDDGIRSGIIQIIYGNLTDDTFTATTDPAFPPVKYVFNQRKLFPITYDVNKNDNLESSEPTYYIEYEEEYLHNFDASDNYGTTEFDGMKWGLDGVQLSYYNKALFFDSGWGDWIDDIISSLQASAGVSPVYDFYVSSHDTDISSQANKYTRAGYDFTNKIIAIVNGQDEYNHDESDDIGILTLDQQPKSAIEYCYNRNKRDSEGNVVMDNNTGWYLPATDEVEEIVMGKYKASDNSLQYAYSRFLEFQSQFYWSSQPAFLQNRARYEVVVERNGNYYFDDVSRARATSVFTTDTGFDYERSGVTGYYHGIRVYNDWFTMKNQTYTSGSLGGVTLNTIDYQPGNQPRTEKNRIRCVRKK